MTEVIDRICSDRERLVKITCSSPMRGEYIKLIFRRIEGGRFLLERYKKDKVFHETIEPTDFEKCLKTQVFGDFKQSVASFTDCTLTILTNKRGTVTVKRSGVKTLMKAVHDREKSYLFKEGEDIPALRELGVFTAENKISAKMHDKYRQINRFIEIVDDAFDDPPEEMTILDFGCGKSYLTFLLYYFTVKKRLKTHIIGYDLKADVVEKCSRLAEKYGYDGLEFRVADVKKDKLSDEKIDMIVSLHACDTATDYALSYAIGRGVKYIFSAPCCQHEINAAIAEGGDFDIMLEHGLIKERFSALLTDAIRAKVIENAGYRVDCLEFVGIDASSKNLMIRAVYCGGRGGDNGEIIKLLKKYNVRQTLTELVPRGEGDKQEEKNG